MPTNSFGGFLKTYRLKFTVSMLYFLLAACAHRDIHGGGPQNCRQVGKLEIQFLSRDDGALGSKDQKFFSSDKEFIETDSEYIRRAFTRACENAGPEKSGEMLFLGRILEKSTHRSLWLTSKGRMTFENRKVNLPEAEVDALIEKVEALLPKE